MFSKRMDENAVTLLLPHVQSPQACSLEKGHMPGAHPGLLAKPQSILLMHMHQSAILHHS